MKRLGVMVLVVVGLAWGGVSAQQRVRKTDAQIRQEIIQASISGYAGNCPCPYNTDRAGRRCGKRSAHSRPGGAAPICFDSEVTAKMVEAYRKKTKQ